MVTPRVFSENRKIIIWRQALFTCNLEGAFACSSLVNDITGVFPPAVSIQATDGVFRLIFLGVEGSSMEQPVW